MITAQRQDETIGSAHRWVCLECIALLGRDIEQATIGPRPEQCAVCGVKCAERYANLIQSADAEEAHRRLAALPPSERWPRMLQDNVLLLADWLRDRRVERTSAGGIVLPGTDKPGDMEAVLATVVNAGPGAYDEAIKHDEGVRGAKQGKSSRKFVPCDLRRGDRVLVDHAISGDPYLRDGIEYRIVRAGNVIGVVEEEAGAAE